MNISHISSLLVLRTGQGQTWNLKTVSLIPFFSQLNCKVIPLIRHEGDCLNQIEIVSRPIAFSRRGSTKTVVIKWLTESWSSKISISAVPVAELAWGGSATNRAANRIMQGQLEN